MWFRYPWAWFWACPHWCDGGRGVCASRFCLFRGSLSLARPVWPIPLFATPLHGCGHCRHWCWLRYDICGQGRVLFWIAALQFGQRQIVQTAAGIAQRAVKVCRLRQARHRVCRWHTERKRGLACAPHRCFLHRGQRGHVWAVVRRVFDVRSSVGRRQRVLRGAILPLWYCGF